MQEVRHMHTAEDTTVIYRLPCNSFLINYMYVTMLASNVAYA
jgi:hypothetical protein